MTDDSSNEENRSLSLELFFIEGKPNGMLTATVPFQWTGHVLVTPRESIPKALARKETERTGVYILLGETDKGSMAYIGETEEVRKRIKDHVSKRAWWTTAVLITSSDDDLNKAHVRYLESRLINTALDAGKINLENERHPTAPSLSEAAKANMEGFLETIFMVLPAIQIDIFMQDKRTKIEIMQKDQSNSASPKFELSVKRNKTDAQAELVGGDFIVLEGSIARLNWEGKNTANSSYARLFNELVEQGILREEGENRVFTENYAFRSSSAAGAVVNGRPSTGPNEWKLVGTTKTYKEWEEERLAKALPKLTLDDLGISKDTE